MRQTFKGLMAALMAIVLALSGASVASAAEDGEYIGFSRGVPAMLYVQPGNDYSATPLPPDQANLV